MGLQTSLCPADKWCTFQTTSNYTITVQLAYLAALLLLSIIIFRYFYKLIQYRRDDEHGRLFGDVFVDVFKVVVAWLVGSLGRVGLGIGVYYRYMEGDFVGLDGGQAVGLVWEHERAYNDGIVICASIYTFLDFICSFLINYLMILIPYQWLKTILLSISENRIQSMQLRKQIGRYFTILAGVRIYHCYVRLIYLALLFLQPVLFFFVEFLRCQWPTANYLWVVGEAGLILLFYVFCALAISFIRENNLVRIKPADQTRIKIQYTLLLTVLLFRITINSSRLLNLNPYNPNQNCSQTSPHNKTISTIFLTLHHIFMHLLPIGVILYIYRPSPEDRKRDESLVRAVGEGTGIGESLRTGGEEYGVVRGEFYRGASLISGDGGRKMEKQFDERSIQTISNRFASDDEQ